MLQILHKGQIAEMRTGEGKTLVAILPAVLNALTGQGVHVRPCCKGLLQQACIHVHNLKAAPA